MDINELRAVSPLSVNWARRFEILGGAPRLVLEKITVAPKTIVLNACTQCSVEQCIRVVSILPDITHKTKITKVLIHIQSESPYTVPTIQYASQTALQTIARDKWTNDREKMQGLLGSCSGNPLAAALCGFIFEHYVIGAIEADGRFKCRELIAGPSKKRAVSILIPSSIRPRLIVERVEAEQE